jgi:acid phosphatase (class A)
MRWSHALRLIAIAVCCAMAGPVLAAPQLAFLKPADVQPATLLPPPPPEGSDAAAAEMQELHRIAAATTPERWTQAKWDNDNENGTIFQSAIAPGFDLAAMPATAKLLNEVQHEDDAAAGMAKTYFKRTRPPFLDATLKTCQTEKSPQTSYPSGHATMGYSMAVVLSAAMPELGPQLMTRARDYAESRLVCGAHFRSDVNAGQVLGTTVAVLLLHDPAFQKDLDAARAELRAAHLTGEAN